MPHLFCWGLRSSAPAESATDARRVDIFKWLRGGWHLYAENWVYFSGFQLLVLCIDFLLPLSLFLLTARDDYHTTVVGHHEGPVMEAYHVSLFSLLTWPLYLGHLFVGLTILRAKVYGIGYNRLDDDDECDSTQHCSINGDSETDEVKVKFVDFLSGYYLYFPLLLLTFVHGLLLLLGFVCLIIPGLYLMVVLAFVELLYIEYHHSMSTFDRYSDEPQPFTFWQAFTVSVERVHPHFWRIAGFIAILTLLGYLGSITIIGSVITVPLASLCLVIAFEDVFGLRQDRAKEHTCIFSC